MLVYIDRDFQTIVPNYFENVRNQLYQIKVFLKRHQYKEIERLAMQLRDSGHNYGSSEWVTWDETSYTFVV